MASKLLKVGSEMHGKSKGPADQGLKAKWAGSAPFGRNVTSIGDQERTPGAGANEKRSKYAKMSRSMTGSGPEQRKGYGAVDAR